MARLPRCITVHVEPVPAADALTRWEELSAGRPEGAEGAHAAGSLRPPPELLASAAAFRAEENEWIRSGGVAEPAAAPAVDEPARRAEDAPVSRARSRMGAQVRKRAREPTADFPSATPAGGTVHDDLFDADGLGELRRTLYRGWKSAECDPILLSKMLLRESSVPSHPAAEAAAAGESAPVKRGRGRPCKSLATPEPKKVAATSRPSEASHSPTAEDPSEAVRDSPAKPLGTGSQATPTSKKVGRPKSSSKTPKAAVSASSRKAPEPSIQAMSSAGRPKRELANQQKMLDAEAQDASSDESSMRRSRAEFDDPSTEHAAAPAPALPVRPVRAVRESPRLRAARAPLIPLDAMEPISETP
eukprot:scaffold141056_cov27-Tisochrysis_lutea.AAC.2